MSSQGSNLDRLLKARAEIDDELRRHKVGVTLLFTDLVGSTAYFDRYGDTAGVALVHRHAELASTAVAEFHGRVIKTIGDSVMAEFPEPSLSVRAAVEIQRRLFLTNQKLPERERLQVRIGINHGPAYRHGSDVYGDAVNLAARITKRTGPAQILISRSVRDGILAETELRCAWLGKVTLEGKAEKEEIFEVIWTDTATYTDLRRGATEALARGELVSPGLTMDDLVQPGLAALPALGEQPKPDLAVASGPEALTSRYEILGELGSGGMGIVYKARDRETGEVVAVKVLKPEIAANQAAMERFKNELRLARKITHKNVCRIHEFSRADGTAYISMEFVDGESLRLLLNRVKGLSVRHGLEILRQVMAGLAEAHVQGVVHRDLKPENIVIARNGSVKVMDFGIARSVEGGPTGTGSIIGTPAYMSPEQAQGKSADARSDIYSLGLVMYEMFTGQPAFRAETPVALAMKQVQETPTAPREVDPHLPSFVASAIQKCTEKKPPNRFQSVAELESALSDQPQPAVLQGEPVVVPRLSRWQGLDWALLIVGLVGLVYFLVFRDRAFPASRMRLEVDKIAARNIAAEFARARLGRAPPGILYAQAELALRSDPYLELAYEPTPDDVALAKSLLAPGRFQMLWQLRFPTAGGSSDGLALVDGHGKVERLRVDFDKSIPACYQAAALEECRALAKSLAEQVCGALPGGSGLTETFAGEGPSYTAAWGRRLQVSLQANKVVDVKCSAPLEPVGPLTKPIGTPFRQFTGSVIVLALLALFLMGRCFLVPGLWKRLPLAILLGLMGTWLVWLAAGAPRIWWLSFPSWFTIALAAIGLAFMALATAEQYLRRGEPERVATYLLAWMGHFTKQAVGWAVIRGALAGLVLIALETLMAYKPLAPLAPTPRAHERSIFSEIRRSAFVDPTPVADAVQISWSGLFTVGVAIFDGAVIGLILLGLQRAFWSRALSAPGQNRKLNLIGGVAILWWCSAFHLHLAEFVATGGTMGIFLLEALLLAWLLDRYDVLTVMMAVTTAVLWIINYPLLEIFSEVGNGSQWIVFLGWGVVVLLAAAMAFRPSLSRARQRMMAPFE